ncbi:hypothetical protein VP1G_10353 [Cytospora mali]|uniref:Asl1-like glycosyl hydrolase catalytic domain-containing protein n=1 Tax=Cytospora mali TaxID=578113 RepID=A0A194VGS4_CYTMA|nr:hypothetical protein VP1G_10353 [Valsa mali var. pyri (nom. inval.)]
MFTKACLAVLATVALTSNGVLAANHGHAQRHHHENKRDIVYESTETVTDTTWVTVTVDPNSEPATTAPVVAAASTTSSSIVVPSVVPSVSASSIPTTSSTSSIVIPTTTAIPSVSPTTLLTSTSTSAAPVASSASSYSSVAPIVSVPVVSIAAFSSPASSSAVTPTTSSTTLVASTSSAAAASSSAVVPNRAADVSTSSSSTNKRGAAYNTASLISPLIGSGSHIGWAYNWGQVDDGLSSVDSSLEFVPMLWSTREDFISTWESNAQTAISNGAKNFLSFNEPDNAGQANMDPATAASAFIQYMNPYAGSVSLGSPAITNSGTDGEGVSWLKEWVSSCGGSCAYSFCAAHWYSPADSSDFLNFVSDVYEACGNKPVWITEFAPTGADDSTISSFLEEVQDALDNDSTYSFVERYAYFYVADGYLVDGSSASSYGNTFAYGS